MGEHRVEMIGKVPMILDNYSGSDHYSDGDDYENFLLEVTKENGDIDYSEIIAQNPSTPTVYHLSHLRENIICWYPFSSDEQALEIGAGCGAVTGALARGCANVDCVDLSKRRCMINAYRHRDYDNIRIFVSNFEDFVGSADKKYSLVTLNGVFEYSKAYINSPDPFVDMLKMVRSLLAENGTLLIAIENKFGLKYFAGAREDHCSLFFRGIEGYRKDDVARTFGRGELIKLSEAAGFSNYSFYYPYPDYKFPMEIYSDARLPKKGELIENQYDLIYDRYTLFNVNKAFDNIISAGLFPEFSNSFLVELKGGA